MPAGTTTYRASSPATCPHDVLDALDQAGFAVQAPRPSTLAVLDTFDGRIAAAGLRLRLLDDRRLILAGAHTVSAAVTVAGQPRGARDVPPGPLRLRLAKLCDVRTLLRLVEVTSQRTEATRRNRAGKVTAVATVHERPSAGGLSLGEALLVEATELAGYPKPGRELRRVLERLGLTAVDGDITDLAAARTGVPLHGYDVPVGVPLTAEMAAIDGFRAVLGNLRDAMLVNWDGTIADVDPEFLHDLRVAVRRTRVVLANGSRILPDDVRRKAREEFAWLGSITGRPRDLDVYQLEWPDYTAGFDASAVAALGPLRDHLVGERAAAHDEMASQLTSQRADDLLDWWSDQLDKPCDPATLGDRSLVPLAVAVRRRIRRAHRVMIQRGRTITAETPAATVHELRKDAKKLRYLIECFGGLYDKPARIRFVGSLKSLQDTLGRHQDAEVHAAALREIAGDDRRRWDADTMLAIGQLVERLERRRLVSRRDLAARFGAFDDPDTAAALDALLASAHHGARP